MKPLLALGGRRPKSAESESKSDGPVPSPISITPMKKRDLREILPIETASYPTPWTKQIFESELRQVADGTRYYVVARRGADVVGYAGLWIVDDPDGHQAHITNIATAPVERRSGVGSALMAHVAQAAIDRGAVAWTLEVRASNTAAQELYRRFGFAPAGVRKRYYENTEDAIVMWCHDLATPEYQARLSSLAATPSPKTGADSEPKATTESDSDDVHS